MDDSSKRTLPTPRPLNVILYALDSLRADHVHAFGYPRTVSPNLDRFVARVDETTLDAETERKVTQHLRALGYFE